MKRRFEKTGFPDVRQQGTLGERWAPLEPVQHQYIAGQLRRMGALAEETGVPESDMELWLAQGDPMAPDALVNDRGFFWC